MLYALRTHQHVWASPFTRRMDSLLEEEGYTLLPLRWERCEREDEDHFTWEGFLSFSEEVASAMRGKCRRLHILSDSTVDSCNWDGEEWADAASKHLASRLLREGILCTVDAVCGSGFVAMRETGDDFKTRARREGGDLLVIGGWNDECWGMDSIRMAARGVARARRSAMHSERRSGAS